MKSLKEKIVINGTEMRLTEVVDRIKNWMDTSMVINRDRIYVIKENPIPFEGIENPDVEELKKFNYTGIEYLIASCLFIGNNISKKEDEV